MKVRQAFMEFQIPQRKSGLDFQSKGDEGRVIPAPSSIRPSHEELHFLWVLEVGRYESTPPLLLLNIETV